MLSVFQLSIPTPYAVGPVNAYLIKNDPITLIDIGPNTSQARNVLKGMLNSLGVNMADVQRIVITHAHPDHCGLVSEIATGAEVFLHAREESKLRGQRDEFKERMPFVIETGIPAEYVQEIVGEKDKLPRPSLQGMHSRELCGAETLDFSGGQLQVLHLPGHSPGHLCFYDPEQKLFFSGDFLLPHITPNPLMEPDPENPGRRLPALKQYLTGLDLVDGMDIAMVLPGHGGVFSDYKGVTAVGRRHHQFQFDRIADKLSAGGLNAFQISRELYPNLQGWEIFLGLSEVQAHLDLMVDNGKINCRSRHGVNYYSLV